MKIIATLATVARFVSPEMKADGYEGAGIIGRRTFVKFSISSLNSAGNCVVHESAMTFNSAIEKAKWSLKSWGIAKVEITKIDVRENGYAPADYIDRGDCIVLTA